MSELSIDLSWLRKGDMLDAGNINNQHSIRFNEAYEITVDTAPDWVTNPCHINPASGA